MANRDGFTGGFVLGAVLGGALGAVLGAALASRRGGEAEPEGENGLGRFEFRRGDRGEGRPEDRIELARRGLEDKIAQLNAAIDDVREQLDHMDENEAAAEASAPGDRQRLEDA